MATQAKFRYKQYDSTTDSADGVIVFDWDDQQIHVGGTPIVTKYRVLAGNNNTYKFQSSADNGSTWTDVESWQTGSGGSMVYWRVTQSTSGDTTTYTLQYSLDGGSTFNDYDTFTATDTTYSTFNSTTAGLVPAPTSVNTGKFLKGDATWAEPVTISNTLSSGTRVATINGTDILAPSGGGGGADLTFGGGTVTVYTSSLTATIVMDTTQRSYAVLPVDSTWASPASGTVRTVSLTLNLANDYENYILVKNADTVNSLSITIGSVTDSSSTTISNVILPDGGITEIPKAASANAPNYVEFSIVPFSLAGTTYCVITSSAVLK